MLTKEENELLTRVGPGTPGGELLRRYWQPVCIASELTDERPLKRIHVLGEELVLYRSATPEGETTYGLLGEHCSHRGTSLYYGFLEEGKLRCPYHGWLYDNAGHCVEQPFEPAQSIMKHTLKHPAYPVQELGGLLFAYMGPQPAPLLPRWDVLVWEGGHRTLARHKVLFCNWVQAEENTADVTHTYFLHGHTMKLKGLKQGEYYYRPIEQYGFMPFEWGLVKSWHYADDGGKFGEERGGGNPLVFPNMLRLTTGPRHSMHWRVPIDDTRTQMFVVDFTRGEPLARYDDQAATEWDERMPPDRRPDDEYVLDTFPAQDTMAWETQGAIFDRSQEHLGASDQGVGLFRQMLKEQIERVQRGEDPMALVRDPAKNEIIELPGWVLEGEPPVLANHGGATARVHAWDDVFDDRHVILEVPFGTARPRK